MVQVISMKSDLARVATLALAFTGMAYTASAQDPEADDSTLTIFMRQDCGGLIIPISLFPLAEQTNCTGECRSPQIFIPSVNITDPEVTCYFWSTPQFTCGQPGSNDAIARGTSPCTNFETNMTSFQCFKGTC